MRYVLQILTILAIFGLIVSGCKKDDAATNPTTVTHASGAYTGILAGAKTSDGSPVSGTLSLNIPSSKSAFGNENTMATFSVTGTYTVGGLALTLHGTYRTDDDSLWVYNSDSTFRFRGTYNPSTGALSGIWTTPTSSGNFVAQTGSGTTVSLFLGTWNTNPVGTDGTFNMAVKGPAVLGVMATGAYKYPFTGTVSADDSIKIFASYSGFTMQIAKGKFTSAAHDSVNGTFNLSAIGKSANGEWRAKKAN